MSASAISRSARRQVWLLSLGAAALLAVLVCFHSRPRLTHMDFVAGGPGSLEFCDPADPKFLPVVERASPVAMALIAAGAPMARARVDVVVRLRTNTGKPIGPEDLATTTADKISLFVVDPDLVDFQAAVPSPGADPGQWSFSFTPRRTGAYRVFADFTPKATGREMYAYADVLVGGAEEPAPARDVQRTMAWSCERDGMRFLLVPSTMPLRAREPLQMGFSASRTDGSSVEPRLSYGTRACLVAFDRDRTGLAILRPEPAGEKAEIENPKAKTEEALVFKVSIPDPGRYVIWSRVDAGGGEVSAPFWFDVSP